MKSKYLMFAILFAGLLLLAGCNKARPAYDAFAQCLTDKGLTMYGAYWCPHCTDQKELFEDSFQYVNYVECDPNGENAQPEVCVEKDIKRYPTWIYSDGRRWEKVMTFEELGEVTSCTLPGDVSDTEGDNETESNREETINEIKLEAVPGETENSSGE